MLPFLTDVVRERVPAQQAKIKRCYDAKHRARTTVLKQGDRVHIKRLWHVPKGHPRFSEPKKVRKQVGKNTFILSDGKKWHASQLALSLQNQKESMWLIG